MSFDVQRAASFLVEARRQHRQGQPFTPGPAHANDAYAVQDAVARRLGPVTGWKVGASAPDATPNVAPLLAHLVRPSPAAWPSASLHMIGVEAELAFRLGRDIAARSEPIGRDEVFGSIASAHAAIEIVDTRLAGWKEADRLWILADNQSNGGLVYDPDGVPFRNDSYADVRACLVINGEVVTKRTGGNPAGDPRWLLGELVNHCVTRRGGVRAGMFITTGSFTGMVFVEPGASIEVAFEGIGTAAVSFI